MHPTRAALGYDGDPRRVGRSLILPILILLTLAAGCRNPADPQGPTQPPTVGFTLRGIVSEAVPGGDGPALPLVLVEITSGPSIGQSTTTDALGQFSFTGVSGQLNLRFSREGYIATGRTINVTEDVFLLLSLQPEDAPDPDPTFMLTGTVQRGQGDMGPIPGATVEVLDGPRAGDSSTTDELGRYTLTGLSGEVMVRASYQDLDPVEETVEMDEDEALSFTLFTVPIITMCLDLDDEEVHITNDDDDNELILTDWTLREFDESRSFVFVEDRECRASMSGFTLAPGATVIITAGDDPEHDPPTHIAGWCEFVWDNDGDTASLFDTRDELVIEVEGTFGPCGG